MTESEIRKLLERQRTFFSTGKTLPVSFRLRQLEKLKRSIQKNEPLLRHALKKDLGKSNMESYMCEIGLTLSELSWMQRHVRSLAKNRTVPTPLSQFAAHSYRSPIPYGTVLIMSPWNYPLLLTLEPLIDAIAAGNTVILKPSAYAPASLAMIKEIIETTFPADYISVIEGGRTENQALLRQKFDKIFFTGSKAVGKEVLRHAAENLTPVTLELGGKSPCIVDSTAKIPLAARRIVFGKFLNCGQTCVAPDYILCHHSVRQKLVAAIRHEIQIQFGESPLLNPDYGKIINAKHFQRLSELLDPEKIVCGGNTDAATLRIEPTVMADVTWEDAVMEEELFGPLLPILTYDTLEEVIRTVESHPHPLALYFSVKIKPHRKKLLRSCRFGGGCINDTVIHLATSSMPFGGIGESGMGSYHGKPVLNLSVISGVLWTKRLGWIFRSDIRNIRRKKKSYCGYSCNSSLLFLSFPYKFSAWFIFFRQKMDQKFFCRSQPCDHACNFTIPQCKILHKHIRQTEDTKTCRLVQNRMQ